MEPIGKDMSLHRAAYLELRMFDSLRPKSLKRLTRRTVTQRGCARVNIYMAARKWDMAAAFASHLVKVDPGNRRLVDQLSLFNQAKPGSGGRRRPFCCGAEAIPPQSCHDRFQTGLLRKYHWSRLRKRKKSPARAISDARRGDPLFCPSGQTTAVFIVSKILLARSLL